MSRHSFDPQIAAQVGINAAVIYQNICFWIEKNEANGHNFRDGRYWTYNSVAAFAKLFPYLTERQIRFAIDKLIEAGLVLKGTFGEDKYDRTAWYTLNFPICQKRQMELTETADGSDIDGEPFAIDSKCKKIRYNPDEKPSPSRSDALEVADAEFQQIWDAYPQDRLRRPTECRALFAEVRSEVPFADLAAAARDYATESAEFTRTKVCFLDNWLSAGKWRRHVDESRERGATGSAVNIAAKQRVVETWAAWVRARNGLCRTLSGANVRELLERGLVSHEELLVAGLGR